MIHPEWRRVKDRPAVRAAAEVWRAAMRERHGGLGGGDALVRAELAFNAVVEEELSGGNISADEFVAAWTNSRA